MAPTPSKFCGGIVTIAMTIASVTLYTNSSDTFPTGDPGQDVTAAALAGTPIIVSIGKAWRQKWFWVKLVDGGGNETIAPLGAYRTVDQTAPSINSWVAAGTPATTSIVLTYDVTDNSDQLSELYVSIATTSPANAATIRSIGVQKTAAVVSGATHTFSSLTAGTTYYVSVLATDAAGNSTIETKSLATGTDTTPPSLNSYTLRAPVGAEGNPELDVVIVLTVSDA
jgi:hypothetical protein